MAVGRIVEPKNSRTLARTGWGGIGGGGLRAGDSMLAAGLVGFLAVGLRGSMFSGEYSDD